MSSTKMNCIRGLKNGFVGSRRGHQSSVVNYAVRIHSLKDLTFFCNMSMAVCYPDFRKKVAVAAAAAAVAAESFIRGFSLHFFP